MQREDLIPEPPIDLISSDKDLFIKHFKNRNIVERATYGNLLPQEVFEEYHTIYINDRELNTY